jgi:hypothetical protein
MKKDKNISGLKTPKGYFENFEERLFSKINEDKFPKTTGFNTPDGYFETLEERVLKTAKPSEKPAKVIPLFSKKHLGYAAAVAACLLIGLLVFKNKGVSNSGLDSLQLTTIDQYINDGNLDMSLYDISDYISDKDISDVNFKTQQFSETELENYLLENIDDETILNQEQ